MVFSAFSPLLSANFTVCEKTNKFHKTTPTGSNKKRIICSHSSSFSITFCSVIHKSIVPLAASATILLSPDPGLCSLCL